MALPTVQLKGYENASVFFLDPYKICPKEIFDEQVSGEEDHGVEFWLVSFGGSYFPIVYVTPVDVFSMEESLTQAMNNLYLSKEGAAYRIVKTDKGLVQGSDVVESFDEDDLIFSDEGFMIFPEDIALIEPVAKSRLTRVEWEAMNNL
jgi:hypothetical protein